jgi:glycosyltransferase involved in cell wall biosynthesis
MKVLHVVPYFPPERLGGVGEYAARLHRALRAAGHESRVLTRAAGKASPWRRDEPAQPVPPHSPTPEAGVEVIARTPLGWFLRSALQARRAAHYDVVHVHAGEALPLLLALALRRERPPILTTFHVSYAGVAASLRPYTLEGQRFGGGLSALVERTAVAWGHRAADRIAVALADAVVPITRACAAEILPPERAADAPVILHGLPAPVGQAEPTPPVELLYVGTGGHRKRVHALPFVLSHVRAELPTARLRIVGFDWGREPALRRAFEARGLGNAVECRGPVPSSALPAHYRSAGVLLVPSAYEGLPLVIVEAMQCGLPAVATRVAGHPEAIDDGETGFLVPLDDPRAMAARCLDLLLDPARREAMGRAARETAAQRFAMDRHVDAYLALYARLARERR